MNESSQLRTYDPASCVVFRKTNERFGGLSNMAAGFPLRVNGVSIRTSEALYQACRFPHMPEVQRLIIGENSPMTAKMRGKPYRDQSRSDWESIRTKIMRWCLRVKLAQNLRSFGDLLLETGDKPIVEYSSKDDFWGARPQEDGSLQGMNILGRLLMELREQIRSGVPKDLRAVEPLPLENFLLYGEPIEAIGSGGERERTVPVCAAPPQGSLFDVAPLQARQEPQTISSQVNSISAPVTDTLSPYPQMRTSEMDWLGDIPAHWEVRRIKTVLREFDRRSGTGEEPLFSLRMQAGMVDHHKSGGKPIPPEALAHYKVVEPGDIVMNRMRAAMGLFGIAPGLGLVSPDYATFHTVGKVHRPYLVQLFKTPMMAAQFRAESKGLGTGESGFLRLYTDRFGIIRIPLPPIEEQRAIVRFLDWHGAQVSRLVRAKKRLIALLNEQKQAIIHRAVTRGLDETVPLKPSSVDWLGDIPVSWDVKPLKMWASINARTLGQTTDADYEFDYLDISAVGTGLLNNSPERLRFASSPSRARRIVRRGDTLVSTVRTYLKAIYFVEHDWPDLIASTGFAVLSPSDGVAPKFFGYALQSPTFIDEVIGCSVGVAYPAINEAKLGSIKVPMPSTVAEQEAIVDWLVSATADLDTAIARIQSEVTLIQEYRTRLIADVVTGKLDVRGLAEALPETPAEELAALDDDASEDELLDDAEEDEEAAA